MNSNTTGVFCTAYFPPIAYFKAMAQCRTVLIEGNEHYCKQSYRNRCRILSANGILSLAVPVSKSMGIDIRSVKIDYSKPWLREHKRAMEAAYRSSPFFEYYCDDIFSILDRRIEYLFDLNMALTEQLAVFCGIRTSIHITENYIEGYTDIDSNTSECDTKDYRNSFHPKKQELSEELKSNKYYQVFSDKFGFTDNLSILDLLFNEGPNASSFLILNFVYNHCASE